MSFQDSKWGLMSILFLTVFVLLSFDGNIIRLIHINPYHDYVHPALAIMAVLSIGAYYLHLKETDFFLRLSLDNIHEIISIVDFSTGKIIYISNAAESIIGYKPEELMKYYGVADFFSNEKYQKFNFLCSQEIEKKTGPNEAHSFSCVNRLKKKNGSEIYLESTTVPLIKKGKIVKYISVSRDITERQRMEQALKNSEKKYREIVENSYNVIYTYDKFGKITYINRAVEDHTGLKPEDFLNTFCLEWVHADDRQVMQEILFEKNPGQPISLCFRLLLPSGQIIHINSHNTPLYDEKGNYQGVTSIAINMDKEMEMHEKLQMSEEKYRLLYDHAQVGLISLSFDGSRILMANRKTAEMFGYDLEEMQNLSAGDLWTDYFERKNFVDILTEHGKAFNHPCRARCKDGTFKDFEIFARFNTDQNCIECNLVDVTDKLRAENQLKCQAHILENIPESVMVFNDEGQVVYINQKARSMFGLSEGAMITEQMIREALQYNENELAEFLEEIRRNRFWQGEKSLYLNEEEKVVVYRIDILDNSFVKSVVTAIDITELAQTRRRAEAANLAKSQFLANISHEIRTPMIGILGSVELLETGRPKPEQMENLQVIRECGEQLLNIINEILDVSKIEVGLVTLNPEPCELFELFAKTINMLEPILIQKGLTITMNIDDNLPHRVILDQIKFKQVMTNILFNALKFTKQGGIHLEATSRTDNTSLLVSISDTGIGIPADQLHKIFEPFTQVDNSATRTYGGTGLGLYICNKLVKIMGGNIWAESEEGQGTCFSFAVPLIPAEEAEKHDTIESYDYINPNHDLLLAFNPVKVLLVEDNPLNQKIVSQMLQNYGFEPTIVANGLECLQILQKQLFDIVLMDMQMPVLDGYEATRLIRADHSLDIVPIIAMTANSMAGDREKCLLCGCNSYIAKPFKVEELLREIRKHLTSDNRTREAAKRSDFINALIPEFMSTLAEMIMELKMALKHNNMDLIKSISHDIKGSAGMYGLMSISQLAAQIEQAARSNSRQKVASLIGQLHYIFDQVNVQVS